MSSAPQTHNMALTYVFDAPVEQVWRAWSDSEQVKQWWGPTGFTCPVADMDFREGGTSLVCMRAPQEYGGFDMYNTWTYTKIVPGQRLEFTHHFTDKDGNHLVPQAIGLPPGIPAAVPHVITFEDLGNGKSQIAITEYGYTSEDVVTLSRGGMEQCLDKMAASLADA